MARQRKKRRTHVSSDPNAKTSSGGRLPKSMVIRMGAGGVGGSVSQLTQDFRKMMEPDTASRLKERRGNKLKDYTAMAGPLGVTHLFLFSRSESGNTHLRIALTPRGPTFTFRVEDYTLSKDVAKTQRHPKTAAQDHMTPPLLVMNNFTTPAAEGQTQDPIQKQLETLSTTIFQGMFPAISPAATPLSSIRRIMLLNREPKLQSSENGTYILSLRHYSISTRTSGVSRRVRRFDENAQRAHERKSGPLPNLGRLEDAADYLLDPAGGGYTSASETELDTDAEVEILETPTQRILDKKKAQKERQADGDANGNVEKRSVKLTELGPRMRLRLIKVEEGICEGKVMWNEFVKKSKTEEVELEDKWDERRRVKEARKAVQKENVERKRREKEAKKPKSKADREDEEDASDMEWDSDEIEAELDKDQDQDVEMGDDVEDDEDASSSDEDTDDDNDGVKVDGSSNG